MFKGLFLTFFITSILITSPIQKAQAGTILVASAFATGGTTGAGLLLMGGFFGGVGAPVAAVTGILTKEKSLFWVSLGLVVLEETSQIKELKTIPPYLMTELEGQAMIKAEYIEADQNGMKEVVFTHEEVDGIFELADEETSSEELELLREMLTTKAL